MFFNLNEIGLSIVHKINYASRIKCDTLSSVKCAIQVTVWSSRQARYFSFFVVEVNDVDEENGKSGYCR